MGQVFFSRYASPQNCHPSFSWYRSFINAQRSLRVSALSTLIGSDETVSGSISKYAS